MTDGSAQNAGTVPDREAEDAAAVVLVLALLAANGPDSARAAPTAWGDPAHRLRLRPAPSGTAWWASGLPR